MSGSDSASDGPESETMVVGSDPVPISAKALLERVGLGGEIGRYVILERVGAGGMGEVFRAYDPKLQRELALKRISAQGADEEHQARLVREAQAMAQLNHPNVVAVYDVEVTDVGVIVAMEYVPGLTLGQWLEAPDLDGGSTHRGVDDVLEAFVQAGEGLAAAHRSGLVHRDFKPSNVLVSDDGRVRVADFGLAKEVDGDRLSAELARAVASGDSTTGEGRPSESPTRGGFTQSDVVMGTPKYMAPEQHATGGADERSDQYSFCLTLWEALLRKPAFFDRGADLARAKAEGPPSWPRKTDVPARVIAAIERGLRPAPEHRWPSMSALLDELRPPPTGTRRWVAVSLGGSGVIAASVVTLGVYGTAPAPCQGGPAHLESVWDETVQQRVKSSLVSTEVGYADSTWLHVQDELDRYTDAWVERHRDVCEATAVRKEQSAAVMDLRMSCLHRARREVRAVTSVLGDADESVVSRAYRLVGSLPSLDHCDDVDALGRDVAPPEDPESVDIVAEAREDLARARAMYRVGQHQESLALAEDVGRRVAGLEYPPIEAEVALGRGDVLDYLGRNEDAEAALREALWTSVRVGANDTASKAAASLVFVVGAYLGRPDESLWLGELSVELAKRGSVEPLVMSRARNARHEAYRLVGRFDDAIAEQRANIEELTSAVGASHPAVTFLRAGLGYAMAAGGRNQEAVPLLRSVLDQRRTTMGREHPDYADTLDGLGNVLSNMGRGEDAVVLLREGLEVRTAILGPRHRLVADSRSSLAWALALAGESDEAVSHLRRALVDQEAAVGPEHPDVAVVCEDLGNVYLARGELAKAEPLYRRALAIRTQTYGPEARRTGVVQAYLADALLRRGEVGEALELLRAAVKTHQSVFPAEHPMLARTRSLLGAALLVDGQHAAATEELERAWTVQDNAMGDAMPYERGQTAYWLARASMVGEFAQPERARALARRSVEAFEAAGPLHRSGARRVQSWLADGLPDDAPIFDP